MLKWNTELTVSPRFPPCSPAYPQCIAPQHYLWKGSQKGGKTVKVLLNPKAKQCCYFSHPAHCPLRSKATSLNTISPHKVISQALLFYSFIFPSCTRGLHFFPFSYFFFFPEWGATACNKEGLRKPLLGRSFLRVGRGVYKPYSQPAWSLVSLQATRVQRW